MSRHLFTCPEISRHHTCLREGVTRDIITSFVTKTSHHLAVKSHGIASFGCHISPHGISSFGCHISRHLINWLSHLTASHHLAVTSQGISSSGCHISRHLIIWLSYLTVSHHLAVTSHGISVSITSHFRYHSVGKRSFFTTHYKK
jgi:hypothetical protein